MFVEELKQRIRREIDFSILPQLPIPAGSSQSVFDQFFYQVASKIPTSIQINETIISEEIPANIRSYLATAEDNLKQLKEYINKFNVLFIVLIPIIFVLVICMYLIFRTLKGTIRTLGIILLISGIVELVLFICFENYLSEQIDLAAEGLPSRLVLWLQQFSTHSLSPLSVLSAGFMIGGIVLLLISFFYRPKITGKSP